MANPALPPSDLNEIRQLAELRNLENANDLHRENSAESEFPTTKSEVAMMMQIVEDTIQIYRNAFLHAQEACQNLPIGDPHRYVISAESQRVMNEVKKIEQTIDLALERREAKDREELPKLRRMAAAQNQVAQGCHRPPWKVAGRTGHPLKPRESPAIAAHHDEALLTADPIEERPPKIIVPDYEETTTQVPTSPSKTKLTFKWPVRLGRKWWITDQVQVLELSRTICKKYNKFIVFPGRSKGYW